MTYHLRDAAAAGTQWAIQIADGSGNVVRRLELNNRAGVQRVVWNLTAAPPAPAAGADAPAAGRGGRGGGRGGGGGGAAVAPGRYTASIGKIVNGTFTAVGPAQSFSVRPLPQ